MYAVRYKERRVRLFHDYLVASRFFSATAPAHFQIQLWKLHPGGWENLAWTRSADGALG